MGTEHYTGSISTGHHNPDKETFLLSSALTQIKLFTMISTQKYKEHREPSCLSTGSTLLCQAFRKFHFEDEAASPSWQ